MIEKIDFYFVRHGQTDHNAANLKTEHSDLGLNEKGRRQAEGLVDLVANLPIKTVCFSPLLRAKETKNIITSNLNLKEQEIFDLRECSSSVWFNMSKKGKSPPNMHGENVALFMQQVLSGINSALMQEGPVLIVAHGGVHFALCCMMGVTHEWAIDNCVPIHFSHDEKWRATKLI